MISLGSGPPLILIPGIQGRWEWMRPTVEALGRRLRVVTFSLCGERGAPRLGAADGMEPFLAQMDDVLERAGLRSAAICGVSYGGLIALCYAARRPERTDALIMVATPGPGWRPDAREARYVRWPLLSTPEFCLRSPGRLWPEIRTAHDSTRAAVTFGLAHAGRVLRAPMRPRMMARRIRCLERVDRAALARDVSAPALIITGEPRLDRVVNATDTAEYARLIPRARHVTLARSGHIGLITRADAFARIVDAFVRSLPPAWENSHQDHPGRADRTELMESVC